MQAFTDVPVKCCDCEQTFLSASSLLQHFAEHVKIQFTKDNYDRLKLISRRCNHNRFNNNNYGKKHMSLTPDDGNSKNTCSDLFADSTVLTSSSNDNSLHSVISDKSEVTSGTELSSLENQTLSLDNRNLIDDDNHLDTVNGASSHIIPLHKLSVQETQKKVVKDLDSDVNASENSNSKQFCIEFDSAKMIINIERMSPSDNNVVADRNNEVSKRTVDFLDDDVDRSDENFLKRKLSNRKQLLPKKIERLSNGLVKIAPKPENMTAGNVDGDSKTKTAKKKYNCQLCTKTFGWSTDLKRHILVHTGERPFKCNKCDACFTRNFLLQKHKNKLHANNRDVLEKNKLLEEKVNENLKLLKNKMKLLADSNKPTNENVTICNVNAEDFNVGETGRSSKCNNINKIAGNEIGEVIFEESEMEIKEEIIDPLVPDPLSSNNNSLHSDNYDKYENWLLNNNNNNNVDTEEIKIKEEFSISKHINEIST